MIYSLFSTKQHIDILYKRLKNFNVHFAIVFLDGYNQELINLLKHETNILTIYSHESLILALNCIEYNKTYQGDIEDDNRYPYVLIVKKLSFLSQKLIYFAELKIHKLIAGFYEYLLSYHCIENEFRKFPIYGASLHNEDRKSILIIEKANGYGDSIISMVMLSRYTQLMQKQGFHIDVWHSYDKSFHLGATFLPGCCNEYSPLIDNRSIISEITFNKKYYAIKNFDDMIIHNAFTKIKDVAEFLGCDYNFQLSDLQPCYQPLDPFIENELLKLTKQYKYVIGIQFYTDDNKLCSYKREWNSENVKSILHLCNENQIGVINLAPYYDDSLVYDCDASHLKIPDIITIISRLDMVLGIDSCCGHFAGILEIPNLILWGKILDKKSQRPVSCNYSIVSKSGIVDHISPALVMERILQILNKSITLPHTINFNAHFRKDKYTEYIDRK